MLLITSRAIAEKKLAEAGRDERHRRCLTKAAEGWLFVASQLRAAKRDVRCQREPSMSEIATRQEWRRSLI